MDKYITSHRKKANIKSYHTPKSPKEITTLVKTEKHIIPVGSRMSFSRVDEPRTATTFISSERIDHIYRVSRSNLIRMKYLKQNISQILDPIWQKRERRSLKRYFYRIGSGCTISQIREYLHKSKMDLPHTLYSEEITIGGAISTGSHGSSVHVPMLASIIVSIRIILPDGNLLTVERKNGVSSNPVDLNEDALFNSICCGFGAFGMIYDCILVAIDKMSISTKWEKMKWMDLKPSIGNRVEDALQLELFLDKEKAIVCTKKEGKGMIKPFFFKEPNPYMRGDKPVNDLAECAVTFKSFDEIGGLVDKVLAKFPDNKFYISFGRTTHFYLSSTYSTKMPFVIYFQIYPKSKGDLDKVCHFENYMRTIKGRVCFSKIYGPVIERPGILEWRRVLGIFKENPFKIDFIRELCG
jgi:FAD binding domain